MQIADCWFASKVLNADDLVGILGPRPFTSEVIRNIDIFKAGFQDKPDDGATQTKKPAAPSPEADAATLDGKVIAF